MKVYLEPATAIEYLFTASSILGMSGGGGPDVGGNITPEDVEGDF